jgi:hypothetical protein
MAIEGDKLMQMAAVEGGYKEEDYVVERHEYNNCTHEYVAPKGYTRPEYKRPA